MKSIRTVIVDDEELVITELSRLLDLVEDFEISATCRNGREAIDTIMKLNPDVVFLDIEMPDVDGLEVIETISEYTNDITWVFVSAHDEHAVKAFDLSVYDFLLKPFNKKRFLKTISRLRSKIGLATQKEDEVSKKYLEKFIIKENGLVKFIDCKSIIYIESDGNYLRLFTTKGNHTIRYSLKKIEMKLNPRKFFRIHRSRIVNIDFIDKIEQWFSGDYSVFLSNGEKVKMSRNYKEVLEAHK